MLGVFGSDFLAFGGAQVCHNLADGRAVRLRNAGGRLILAVEGKTGHREARVFNDLEAALHAWLAYPDEPGAG